MEGDRAMRTRHLLPALWAVLILVGMAVPVSAAPGDLVGISGLSNPVRADVADDGRVFIAEHPGIVKVAASQAATEATTILDITDRVGYYEDLGLTMLLHHDGYLYLGYTVEQSFGDQCADITIESGGCPTTAQVSRFPISADDVVGAEEPLLGGMPEVCTQFTRHGPDDLEVGPDGRLYVSIGDGAGFTGADVGQEASSDFCGEPEREQGARRAQTDNGYNGKIVSMRRVCGTRTASRWTRTGVRGSAIPAGRISRRSTS